MARHAICGLPALALLLLAGCAAIPLESGAGLKDGRVNVLADELVRLEVGYDPTLAYQLGMADVPHSEWPDRSPRALESYHSSSEALLSQLRSISRSELSSGLPRTIHGALLEKLEARRQARVCRNELWASISHMGGWHSDLASVAEKQPVTTGTERSQALTRWSAVPELVDQEIANARAGLARGYSSPKTVVEKVVGQLDRMLAAPVAQSPLNSPARRTDDSTFKQAFGAILEHSVLPALVRYRDFLAKDYLPQAREALGLSAHPEGAACYAASLRNYTTLDRVPEDVFRIGREAVSENARLAQELGQSRFGTTELDAIVRLVAEAPDNRFSSEDELIEFARETVSKAHETSRNLFVHLPEREVRVEPIPAHLGGAGANPYYEPGFAPGQPAYYRINADAWRTETRGSAEITAAHEAYPGHHLQIGLAYAGDRPPIMKLMSNAAFVEGWGRYAEKLAEEAGVYRTPYAPITRRLWPARGMVADPGLHLFGWTRQQVIDYFVQSGRLSASEATDIVDRMAILPGQLTAYDSGALEIIALRKAARERLGTAFDLREFHQRVLEHGPVPLSLLRSNVEEWIATEEQKTARN